MRGVAKEIRLLGRSAPGDSRRGILVIHAGGRGLVRIARGEFDILGRQFNIAPRMGNEKPVHGHYDWKVDIDFLGYDKSLQGKVEEILLIFGMKQKNAAI